MQSIRRASGVTVFAVLLASGIQAQHPLTGKWQGQTPNGSQLEVDLTVDAQELSGTLTREGQRAPIAEGKVSKNTFTFKATLNDQTEAFTGELDGDVIKVWLTRQGPERAAVLKRAKGGARE